MSIAVLHGAIVNAGDFLIRHRAVSHLRDAFPDIELVELDRRTKLTPDVLEDVDAIVLAGGPSLREDFHPGIYPLVDDISSLSVPILPLANGWSGKTKSIEQFEFTPASRKALDAIHERIGFSSVRDDLSLELMGRMGYQTVRSGCVAWYRSDMAEKGFEPPTEIRTIAFSVPAEIRNLRPAAEVARTLRKQFPDARVTATFNRGLRWDSGSRRRSVQALAFAAAVRAVGVHVSDIASSHDGLEAIEAVDLHVGYRVHSHLAALSCRRPSLLIAEDGRGTGQNVTLHDPYDIDARSPTIADDIRSALVNETRSGFAATAAAVEEIRATAPVMAQTIEQLRPLVSP